MSESQAPGPRDREWQGSGPHDREPTPGSLVGRSVEEFVNQLRTFGDRARTLAGSVPGRLPGLPALPSPPGALSAAQLRSIQAAVKAQRLQLDAMRAQLAAFDQQLGVFERVLDPLVEWSSTWASLEEAVGDLVRREPPASGTEGSSAPS
jgi:hypothetical protein